MSAIFEITGEDISLLKDDDLRTLIGMLCEADYHAAKLGTSGITWGGHQDGADGGLDVIVKNDATPKASSFVPRPYTGFQVKKPNMTATAIKKEMCPKGQLREAIKELIREKGAYIIVSSSASTTDSGLAKREQAMRDAVSEEPDNEHLHLIFLDRGRIATWVRSHPSLIAWVRNKINRPLSGWKPYGNWSDSPQGISDEYLLDDGLRLHYVSVPKGEHSIEEGLMNLRDRLAKPETCIRLVGLSGVGKTRFVQALFDERIGKRPLNQYLAIYTNSDSPIPDPVTLAEGLIAQKMQAVLIVDNCSPELHRHLTKVCAKESTISLLTIEYDVREDLPEETDVFRLEPANPDLIAKLIYRRFPDIGEPNARIIADFSEGNARVAIALAHTVGKGESLANLRDDVLFRRLFHQRHEPNEALMQCAEALALVYSFEGTDATSDKSELRVLASLIGKSANELYRYTNTLKDRGLIQERNEWRAILPHAIANRLAKQALRSIPKRVILGTLMAEGNERLLKSFTRRLGFLHDNTEATGITEEWLSPEGWIGRTNGKLDWTGTHILDNVAPVAPEKTLEMLERWAALPDGKGEWFISRENTQHDNYIGLLRHLAYESVLFPRCMKLMHRFALAEALEEHSYLARRAFRSFFYLYLSGTHASVEMRVQVIRDLWASGEHTSQELALYLLGATLETQDFTSFQRFDFGARPRNYGMQPANSESVVEWYSAFTELGVNFALAGSPYSEKAKKLLAGVVRALWTKLGMRDQVESIFEKILHKEPWPEGWNSIKHTLAWDGSKLSPDSLQRLDRLEKKSKPANLREEVRAYVLSGMVIYESAENSLDHFYAKIERLGQQVAHDFDALIALLPDVIKTYESYDLIRRFGKGVGEGISDTMKLWEAVRKHYHALPVKEEIQVPFLWGMLHARNFDSIRDTIMNELVTDPVLGKYYPYLQTASSITPTALERLLGAMDEGIAPTHMFQSIAWGKAHEPVSDVDLAEYIRKILTHENGVGPALNILDMRFHSSGREHAHPILEIARELLINHQFSGEFQTALGLDFSLANVANTCIVGEQWRSSAGTVCNHLAQAIREHKTSASSFPELLASLAKLQPFAFMDVFLANDIFLRGMDTGDILRLISDSDKLAWCDEAPDARYPIMASAISFWSNSPSGELQCTPIADRILERAPDTGKILDVLDEPVRGATFWGEWANVLQRKGEFFKELFGHENEKIAVWAKSKHQEYMQKAQQAKEWEAKRDRQHTEAFE